MTADRPVGPPVTGWSPRSRPPFCPMEGSFCRLEPLDPVRHGDDLFGAYARDTGGANWTYLPYGPFPDREEFRRWVEAATTRAAPCSAKGKHPKMPSKDLPRSPIPIRGSQR